MKYKNKEGVKGAQKSLLILGRLLVSSSLKLCILMTSYNAVEGLKQTSFSAYLIFMLHIFLFASRSRNLDGRSSVGFLFSL